MSNLLRRLGCMVGKHHRSRRLARLDPRDGQIFSQCTHCGVQMKRVSKGNWTVAR
ncbi:hypothetical protein [Stakelama tenebrarum]|uniref:Uncharacterized protein n=1 Tax=Stakelama tenebrarum TaxID=2711215 RepID=A0A6G6Y5S3_9SPHN|nr:hypothetical protein [Sphingosinithalassobacter tenebrarum]QIG80249.1 hypothetical protein G5C33_10995 [Sphingosinithalassobacter tenebrarum]